MRPHEGIALALVACLVASACSRLTFVRPDASRGKSEQVAPQYDFRDDEDTAGQSSRVELRRARQAYQAGDLAEAADAANAALKKDPASTGAHTLLAVLAERRGEATVAGRHYARAAELSPAVGAMLNNYGAWLCGNGQPAESLAWFDRALADRRYPTPASALGNAGACAAKAGQRDRAERYLRAALSVSPAEPVALAAMAQHEFDGGRYLEARAFSQRRLAAGSASASTLLLASQIEDKLGDKPAAAGYVQRLRTEFPQARAAQAGESTSP